MWTLGPMVRLCGRFRLCDCAIAIVIMTTALRELREAGAAGAPLWTDPAARGGAASTLGLKARLGIRRIEFGIRRFELAGALVVRQYK